MNLANPPSCSSFLCTGSDTVSVRIEKAHPIKRDDHRNIVAGSYYSQNDGKKQMSLKCTEISFFMFYHPDR